MSGEVVQACILLPLPKVYASSLKGGKGQTTTVVALVRVIGEEAKLTSFVHIQRTVCMDGMQDASAGTKSNAP